MKIVKKIIPSLLAATMLVSLSACGGGDEDITVNVTVNNTTSGTTYVPAPTAATGVFTDAPIAGLAYTCGTSSGTTNDSGSFNFYTGNSCSFSFGTAALTVASSKLSSTSPKITPFDITEFSDDPLKAVRFMQLIQSLDKADDGKIDLASLTDKNVDLNAAVSSDTGLQNAFNSLSSSFMDRENQLITAAEALTHFQTQNSSLISKIPADLEVVGWENPNIAGVANPMAPKPHPIRTETQITAATVLPAEITSNMTLTSETLYKIDGRTKVKNGATVTIEPGTVVFGESSDDILIFTKGTKLQAAGTAADPIIFTSKTALLNPADADVRQWGGLTLLGNAPTNQPDPHYEIDETDEDFAYGGSVANDNSGTLKNLYILNSGGTFGQEQEVNGLSFCGVGSGTTVQDIYVENSSDDCIEVWGGTVNITNATMVNCNDDSFDLDQGWSGTATNIVVQQTNTAAAGFEISSGGSTPMTSGKIVNFTINKASGSNEGGIYIKDDTTAVKYINGVVTTYNTDPALFVKKVMTQAQKDATKFADVLLNSTQKFGGSGATDIETIHIANDASYADLKPHPIRTETQITAATVLPAEITSNMTLTSETLYKIDGRTKVKNGATVTIEPGTVVFGESSDDILIFTKGTKLQAAGTAADPIIFTSKTALLNPADADVRQWGGLTLLGNAPTNQPDPHYEIDETDEDFAYGGSVANDNSGTLKNLYILNSGGTFGQEQEVNGLSFCGVGSGTTVQDIYVENSSDDCIEVWGGTVNITNATMVNCNDDSFDLDQGWSGTATNIVVQQTNTAAAGFEISSGGSTPMTSGKIVNFTINKASGSNEGGIYIKDDTTAVKYINGVVTTYNTDPALFVKKVMTQAQKDATKFADVLLNSTQKFGGSGATDIENIHIANDASYE